MFGMFVSSDLDLGIAALYLVYVAIVWALRFDGYRRSPRFARPGPGEVARARMADPFRVEPTAQRAWAPSRGVRSGYLGLLLIPCHWGLVSVYAVMYCSDASDSLWLGLCMMVLAGISGWLCYRARTLLPEIKPDVGRRWQQAALATMLWGASLLVLAGIVHFGRARPSWFQLYADVVAVATVMLGFLLLNGSDEVAAAEKSSGRAQ